MAKVKFTSDTSLAGYAGVQKPVYLAGEEAEIPDSLVAKIAPFIEQSGATHGKRKRPTTDGGDSSGDLSGTEEKLNKTSSSSTPEGSEQ